MYYYYYYYSAPCKLSRYYHTAQLLKTNPYIAVSQSLTLAMTFEEYRSKSLIKTRLVRFCSAILGAGGRVCLASPYPAARQRLHILLLGSVSTSCC